MTNFDAIAEFTVTVHRALCTIYDASFIDTNSVAMNAVNEIRTAFDAFDRAFDETDPIANRFATDSIAAICDRISLLIDYLGSVQTTDTSLVLEVSNSLDGLKKNMIKYNDGMFEFNYCF